MDGEDINLLPEPSKPEKSYWHGIDYLRAFFILLVVADKTQPVSTYNSIFARGTPQTTKFNNFDIIIEANF